MTASGLRETALLLDLHEVARALRVSERTAWGLARRGDLPAVRIGRRLLFDPADLRAFIERQKTTGAGAEK
jgi:excisionase family DNA binding protein